MKRLEVGDLVFIKRNNFYYKKVAESINSWTSHVGIIYHKEGENIQVAESCFPLSKVTPFDKYVARSEGGVLCVKRLKESLDFDQKAAIRLATGKRMGKFYNCFYNYDSKLQFCSKFVADIYKEAIGLDLGEIETFKQISESNPNFPIKFWKRVFLGRIPFETRTITPYSIYESDYLETLFDNFPSKGRFKEL